MPELLADLPVVAILLPVASVYFLWALFHWVFKPSEDQDKAIEFSDQIAPDSNSREIASGKVYTLPNAEAEQTTSSATLRPFPLLTKRVDTKTHRPLHSTDVAPSHRPNQLEQDDLATAIESNHSDAGQGPTAGVVTDIATVTSVVRQETSGVSEKAKDQHTTASHATSSTTSPHQQAVGTAASEKRSDNDSTTAQLVSHGKSIDPRIGPIPHQTNDPDTQTEGAPITSIHKRPPQNRPDSNPDAETPTKEKYKTAAKRKSLSPIDEVRLQLKAPESSIKKEGLSDDNVQSLKTVHAKEINARDGEILRLKQQLQALTDMQQSQEALQALHTDDGYKQRFEQAQGDIKGAARKIKQLQAAVDKLQTAGLSNSAAAQDRSPRHCERATLLSKVRVVSNHP